MARDLCGLFCIFFTYILIIYADYVVIQHIILHTFAGSLWGGLHAGIFNSVIFLLVYSHGRAVLTDPGIVPLPDVPVDFSEARMLLNKNNHSPTSPTNPDEWTICFKCDTYRPPRAHHCKVCNRCVRRMDHHCPWINNCVGEFNQKYFIQFLFYTVLLCAYTLALLFSDWYFLFHSSNSRKTNFDFLGRKAIIGHGIGLLIESLTFGIFVFVMLYDQMMSIFEDETTVENTIHRSRNMKKVRKTRRKPRMALLREVFGYGPVYTWLFPCLSPSTGGARPQMSGSFDV